MTADQYCRDIESHLCRKNDGHLIRIVGPSFERVCNWAERGVPLKVALRGIDRYFERYYAKGPRRRPVRVEFCEADVLDVFDEWRRAVGVSVVRESRAVYDVEGGAEGGAPASATPGERDDPADDDEPAGRSRLSFSAHLERVVARLSAVLGTAPGSLVVAEPGTVPTTEGTAPGSQIVADPGTVPTAEGTAPGSQIVADPGTVPTTEGTVPRSLDPPDRGAVPILCVAIERALSEIAPMRAPGGRGLRGDARRAAIERLRALDTVLLDAARASLDEAALAEIGVEADEELAPFRQRMPPDAYARSREACVTRIVRERMNLPAVAFEQ